MAILAVRPSSAAYDQNQGVEDIAVDTAVPTLKVVQEGDVLYVIGAECFTVYSLDGIARRRAIAYKILPRHNHCVKNWQCPAVLCFLLLFNKHLWCHMLNIG